jgi:uncharacterized membrane protein
VYAWIWRKLPGGVLGKLAGSVLLLAVVVVLLFLVIFPWAEPRLPWNHVNISGNDRPTPSATASPTSGR